MPQGDLNRTFKSNQFRHEEPTPNELMTVEFRPNDPTDLMNNPLRIWARTDTGYMYYTVDGVNILSVDGGANFVNVKRYGAVGDGVTNDTAAIHDAQAAVEQTGGTLFFPPGTYNTTQSGFMVDVTSSNVSIIGQSATLLVSDSGIRFTNCENVRVSSLTITRKTQSPWGGSATGIDFTSCIQFESNNNTISKFTDAIGISGTTPLPSKHGLLNFNKMFSLGEEGIASRFACDYISIEDNEIYGHEGDGILLKGRYAIVQRNFVHDGVVGVNSTGGGITCNLESSTVSERNIIVNNIVNNTGYGIVLEGGSYSLIDDNIVSNMISGKGIAVNTSTTFNPSALGGKGVIISNNHIANIPNDGIFAEGTFGASDITIIGNTIDNITSTTRYHIIATNSIITGNTIKNGTNTVSLRSFSCVVTDNRIYIGDVRIQNLCTVTGNIYNAAGIFKIEDANNVIVANIIITTSTFAGLWATSSSASNNVINGNKITATSAANPFVDNGTDNTVDRITATRKELYRNTAPTTGTYVRGDVAFNSLPAQGEHFGFVCIASGTPGTWVPFGQTSVKTSVAATPQFIGQFAVVGGLGYMAIGVASAADWKQITN